MKNLSPASFRHYGAIVFRLIWTVTLIVAIVLISKQYSNSEDFLNQETDHLLVSTVALGAIAIFAVISTYKLLIATFGKVYIYEDLLRDKEIIVTSSTDDNGHTSESQCYHLYFEQVYGKYAKRTAVPTITYERAKVGSRYYVGVIHGKQSDRIYSVDDYALNDAAKHCLITDIRELGKRAHWRWRAPEERLVKNDGGVKRITPEQIVDDMYAHEGTPRKKHFPVVLAIMATLVVFADFLIPSLRFSVSQMLHPLVLGLVLLLLFTVNVLPIAMIRLGIGYLVYWLSTGKIRRKKKEILAGHYRVALEAVEATEEYGNGDFHYRDIHKLMPIRLESGHTASLRRDGFNEVRPGDKLYVVYLESDDTSINDSIVATYLEKLGKLDFGFDVEWVGDKEPTA